MGENRKKGGWGRKKKGAYGVKGEGRWRRKERRTGERGDTAKVL